MFLKKFRFSCFSFIVLTIPHLATAAFLEKLNQPVFLARKATIQVPKETPVKFLEINNEVACRVNIVSDPYSSQVSIRTKSGYVFDNPEEHAAALAQIQDKSSKDHPHSFVLKIDLPAFIEEIVPSSKVEIDSEEITINVPASLSLLELTVNNLVIKELSYCKKPELSITNIKNAKNVTLSSGRHKESAIEVTNITTEDLTIHAMFFQTDIAPSTFGKQTSDYRVRIKDSSATTAFVENALGATYIKNFEINTMNGTRDGELAVLNKYPQGSIVAEKIKVVGEASRNGSKIDLQTNNGVVILNSKPRGDAYSFQSKKKESTPILAPSSDAIPSSSKE